MEIGSSLKHEIFNLFYDIHWGELRGTCIDSSGLKIRVIANKINSKVRVVFNLRINIKIEGWI